jgi:hypothetical protein
LKVGVLKLQRLKHAFQNQRLQVTEIKMELSSMMFWNIILTLVIAPAFWLFRSLLAEVKRIDILLNKTREEYSTRSDLRDNMQRVMEALHRVEDKLDKVLQKD